MNFYYFSLCHVCKQPKPNLKKCSSCKVLHYCSKEHQLKDWSKHKDICKVITKTNKIIARPKSASAEDFNHYKYSSALLWQCDLGRSLKLFENHMWMFPKVCAICYSSEVTIICQYCVSVAYCSSNHQNSHKETHAKYCKSLRLCLAIHQFIFEDMIPADWLNFTFGKNIKMLPKDVGETLKLMGFDSEPVICKKYVNYIIASEFFSPAINLIYALEKAGFIVNRRGKKGRITIHVIGPDDAEAKMCWPVILEFLSHWITNLKGVKICFIGPKAYISSNNSLQFNCKECQAKNFVGLIFNIEGYYHDHVDTLSRPDLIVVFNSGLHEFKDSSRDTWKKSIPKLISFKGVPSILTAYTETELQKDIARFEQSHLKFLVEPQRNPYANLRPIRNWEEGGEPIFYQNNYIAIVTRK